MIVALVCVDHKDLVRRTDEKKSTLSDAPIYIMGSKKPSVQNLTTFKNSSGHIFLIDLAGQRVSLFFAEQNEQAQYSAYLQAFKTISKTNTQRTLPNKNEQKTNNAISISTWFELLCSVVRQGSGYTPVLMLTLASCCPVRRFRAAAWVACRRKQGTHKSAHSARVTVTRHRYCHPENHADKGFSQRG